jgi:hypothetical protein
MVSDASSGGSQKPPDRGAPGDRPAEDPHHVALTQELARLLAAAIAQQQASNSAGGAPLGSELANLASLVARAGSQRNLAPVFNDGLSALSYARSQPSSAPAAAPEQAELPPDDEPMPIPSTWRQPRPPDDEGWIRKQMGAAGLGLLAGLIIVVPTVLWLSGWLSGAQRLKAGGRTPVADVRPTEVKTVKVQIKPAEHAPSVATPYVTGSVEPTPHPVPAARPAEQAAAVATVKPIEPPRPQIEDLLTQARLRVEAGDVRAARDILAAADAEGKGAALFALAETYDPNMLAAWGTRGVAADVIKARALYRKALEAGAARSQARLDALR